MTGRWRTSLRPAAPDDEAELIELLEDSFRTTWAPQVSAAAQRQWFEADKAGNYVRAMAEEFVIAEAAGYIAGMVHWRAEFIHALHVHSRFRRRGIGSLLLRHAEDLIASSGNQLARLETDSFNVESRAFYAAHGFREVGARADAEWNSGITTLLLEKPLE